MNTGGTGVLGKGGEGTGAVTSTVGVAEPWSWLHPPTRRADHTTGAAVGSFFKPSDQVKILCLSIHSQHRLSSPLSSAVNPLPSPLLLTTAAVPGWWVTTTALLLGTVAAVTAPGRFLLSAWCPKEFPASKKQVWSGEPIQCCCCCCPLLSSVAAALEPFPPVKSSGRGVAWEGCRARNFRVIGAGLSRRQQQQLVGSSARCLLLCWQGTSWGAGIEGGWGKGGTSDREEKPACCCCHCCS